MLRSAIAVVIVLTLAACGGDSFANNCQDSCRTSASCPGSTADASSCKSQCDKAVALNKAADCTDLANDLSDCSSDIDVCDSTAFASKCSDKAAAYNKCVTDFCVANPSNTNCQ